MNRPKVRPTFSIPLSGEANETMDVVRERLKGSGHADCTASKGRCAEFFVPDAERRLWSPYLSIQVEGMERRSVLRGRFGPHPEVWTLYMFFSFGLAFLALMGTMLGFVQWQTGTESWGFWGTCLGASGLAALYLVSAIGQRLSAHQMDDLRARLDPLLEGLRAEDGT